MRLEAGLAPAVTPKCSWLGIVAMIVIGDTLLSSKL
jgi:hypothetical protein